MDQANPPIKTVRSGNFCTPSAGPAQTAKGTPMACRTAKDGHNRWQRRDAAPATTPRDRWVPGTGQRVLKADANRLIDPALGHLRTGCGATWNSGKARPQTVRKLVQLGLVDKNSPADTTLDGIAVLRYRGHLHIGADGGNQAHDLSTIDPDDLAKVEAYERALNDPQTVDAGTPEIDAQTAAAEGDDPYAAVNAAIDAIIARIHEGDDHGVKLGDVVKLLDNLNAAGHSAYPIAQQRGFSWISPRDSRARINEGIERSTIGHLLDAYAINPTGFGSASTRRITKPSKDSDSLSGMPRTNPEGARIMDGFQRENEHLLRIVTSNDGPERQEVPDANRHPLPGRVSGERIARPRVANPWGGAPGPEDHFYHPDGAIPYAITALGADADLDVDGESLANRLGQLASDGGFLGRISSQAQADEVRALARRMPEGSQAALVMSMLANDLDAPALAVPELPEGTPEPLVELVRDLVAIPSVRRNPYRELYPLVELVRAGRVRPGRAFKLETLRNKVHESKEGKFAIDQRITAAIKALG